MASLTLPASPSSSETRMTAAMPYILWGAQALLALTFFFVGSMKFVMSADEMTKEVDLPLAFLRFIGVCEILGAAGLMFPGALNIRRGLTPLAAAGLVVIMTGAVAITVATMGVAAALFPLGVGVLAAFVAYRRWSWLVDA